MKVVAGLGNPGRTYDRTRHNAGFHVLDELARRWGGRFRSSLRFRVQSCRVTVEGAGEVLLVKPQSSMNRSGEALEPVMRKHGVAPGQTLIVYDDADLPEGVIRMRARGSAGGHNGMKSVMARLGTDAVPRLRREGPQARYRGAPRRVRPRDRGLRRTRGDRSSCRGYAAAPYR